MARKFKYSTTGSKRGSKVLTSYPSLFCECGEQLRVTKLDSLFCKSCFKYVKKKLINGEESQNFSDHQKEYYKIIERGRKHELKMLEQKLSA